MEFVGFLFQAIIRNPLKRAPFRWIEILDSESLCVCVRVSNWASEEARKHERLMSDKITRPL